MTVKYGSPSECGPALAPSPIGHASGYVSGLMHVLAALSIDIIDAIVERLLAAYAGSKCIYLFGNGGSAALASHAACDLGKGTAVNGNRRFRILSLAENMALITAWANDARYEDIFAEQLRNLCSPGDISFAISGSGNSPNVLNALNLSHDLGGYNIGLTGFQGGKMKALCDLCLVVPSNNMQQIEDAHVVVSHAIFTAVRAHVSVSRSCTPSAG